MPIEVKKPVTLDSNEDLDFLYAPSKKMPMTLKIFADSEFEKYFDIDAQYGMPHGQTASVTVNGKSCHIGTMIGNCGILLVGNFSGSWDKDFWLHIHALARRMRYTKILSTHYGSHVKEGNFGELWKHLKIVDEFLNIRTGYNIKVFAIDTCVPEDDGYDDDYEW